MNAIILAAGTASRFVPLSEEYPKGLLEVKGEILIERQIRQLQEAGIKDITLVTGYKADLFSYLQDKFGVSLVLNEDYYRYNNTSSVIRVLDRLGDTFICCSDLYFSRNVFMDPIHDSYYAAKYASGNTGEYCLQVDARDYITGVSIGGKDAWYMAGHVYFTQGFSALFKEILRREYNDERVRNGYWEDVYIHHLEELPLQMRRYSKAEIFEFDTLDELRSFDESYVRDTRSSIVKQISSKLSCDESDLHRFKLLSHGGEFLRFSFSKEEEEYIFDQQSRSIIKQA